MSQGLAFDPSYVCLVCSLQLDGSEQHTHPNLTKPEKTPSIKLAQTSAKGKINY